MGINIVQPKQFTIRLSNCGVDTFRGNYKTMKDEDALKLSLVVNHIVINDFIKDANPCVFQYELACKLLKEVLVADFNKEDLIKDIQESDKFIGKWKLKQTDKKTSPKGDHSPKARGV